MCCLCIGAHLFLAGCCTYPVNTQLGNTAQILDVIDFSQRKVKMYVIDLRIRNEKIPQIKQMQVPKVQIGLSVPLASGEEKEVALFLKVWVG